MTIEAPEIPTQTQPPAAGEWAPAAATARGEMTEAGAGTEASVSSAPRQGRLSSLWHSRKDQPVPAAAEEAEPKPVEAGKQPQEAAAEEKREGVLPKAAMFFIVPFFVAYYLVFFSGATIGQAFVLSSPQVVDSLPGNHTFTIDFATAATIGAALEFASIGLLLFSLIVRIEGERGMVAAGLSYGLAAVAIGLNLIGHLWINDVVGAVVFTLCSLVAFISGGLMVEFFMRQLQRRRGMRVHASPRYGFRRLRKDPELVLMAKEEFERNPSLGLLGSLEAAREKREEERAREANEKRTRMVEELLYEVTQEEYGHEKLAKLQVLIDNPEATAEELVKLGNSAAAAKKIQGRMTQQRTQAALDREQRIAAELAAEFSAETAPNPSQNRTKNNGSKIARMSGRIGKIVGREFNENDGQNESENNSSNQGRIGASESDSNEVESDANTAEQNRETVNMPHVENGQGGREAARAYIAGLLSKGVAWKSLPSGRDLEKKFGFGTEFSNGGNGNALKRQVRDRMDKELSGK